MALSRTRRSPSGTYLWYLLVAVLLGGAAVLLLPVYRDLANRREKEREVQEQLRRATEELAELKSENESLNTPAGVEKVAREKYRMVRRGDTVLVYERKPRQQSQKPAEKID